MSCRRRSGYRRFSTSAYRLLGDFEVAITGGVWVATGGLGSRTSRIAWCAATAAGGHGSRLA